MRQKIAILDDSMINTLLEQQQKILNLLQDKISSNNSNIFCNVRDAAKILNITQYERYEKIS